MKENHDFFVVDNFYQDPLKARELGLTCEYLPKEAGLDGEICIESRKSYFNEALVKKLESIIQKPIDFDPAKFAFGVFAKAETINQGRSRVHVDPTDWVGIVYLSERCSSQSGGGTSFYQHIKTGFSRLPNDKEAFIKNVLKRDAKDLSAWREIHKVEMKFNRLLLIKAGELFHKATNYFGENSQSARLTQLFFFNEKKAL
ncbi:MAG: DUF6445 family protein [Bacteriovoracaceae bacterium]